MHQAITNKFRWKCIRGDITLNEHSTNPYIDLVKPTLEHKSQVEHSANSTVAIQKQTEIGEDRLKYSTN